MGVMELPSALLTSFASLLISLPLCLVWGIGFGVAMARRQDHPQVSTLAMVTFGLLLALAVGRGALVAAMPYLAGRQSSVEQVTAAYSIFSMCTSLINAALWGCVLVLIFGWRRQP
jgi:hypothetical protein